MRKKLSFSRRRGVVVLAFDKGRGGRGDAAPGPGHAAARKGGEDRSSARLLQGPLWLIGEKDWRALSAWETNPRLVRVSYFVLFVCLTKPTLCIHV